MNYSVIFEMLCSERSNLIFFSMKYHIDLFFLGTLSVFKEKITRDLEQGALLRKFLHFLSQKLTLGEIRSPDK